MSPLHLIAIPFFLMLFVSLASAQEAAPPATTNTVLSLEELLALAAKPDDRSQMIPELKAIITNAKKYNARVVMLTAEGQSHYPKPFEVTEKWVDGKWVISSSESSDFPGKDKQSIQAMTYDKKTKTFVRYNKHPAMGDEPSPIVRENGKQVGDTRSIKWIGDAGKEGTRVETTETYSDTVVNWKMVMTESGKYKMTMTGSAKKAR